MKPTTQAPESLTGNPPLWTARDLSPLSTSAERTQPIPPGNASHKGEPLTTSFAKTPLGIVMATVSPHGICSIALGTNPESLRDEIRSRFPHAIHLEDSSDKTGTAAAVASLIQNPGTDFPLPLDIRGTTFQQTVWTTLREIPAGQTTTYAELARRIGAPKAARAVGAACGANRLAIIIPCHRVISSAGKLTGYRWGLEWKRTLLEHEALHLSR